LDFKTLYDNGQHAALRNLYITEVDNALCGDEPTAEALDFCMYLANSCQMLCDYDNALKIYERVISVCGKADSGGNFAACAKNEIKNLENRRAKTPVKYCECLNCPPLHQALLPLMYVFNKQLRNVFAFAVDSADEYVYLIEDRLGISGGAITPFESFHAVGYYNNPNAHMLVFKRHVAEKTSPFALTGLCAHEIAHFELTDTNIRSAFNNFSNYDVESRFFNERLTDFYVISKGFGRELAAFRREMEQIGRGITSPLVMDAMEIENIITKGNTL
jgi:hypothetical protein